jgi:beta-galactosidase/beta-glucuronidase
MNTMYLENWKFSLAKHTDPWSPGFDDRDWQDVIVPHDWAVSFPFSREYSSGTGYLPGGTGWYRTRFSLPTAAGMAGTAIINFDGVYKNSRVWCNGYYLGCRPSGYAGFSYDISHCLREGENLIAVKVSHEDIADSRWYTGSGIYRKVTVDFHDPAYIPRDRVIVTTELRDGKALVHVSGEIQSPLAVKDARITAGLSARGAGNAGIKAEVRPCMAEAGEPLPFDLDLEVPDPRLWSPEEPNLYTLSLEGSADHGNGRLSRIERTLRIGLRTIRFDPDRGFFINGRGEKFRGVCVHHDAGCLGAAVRPEVWRRRLEKLKAAGCNAIRMSHNPHMNELYDLCDEMGFFVMDEAFDEWEGCKNKWSRGHNVYPPVHQGYAEDFPQWHERDLADMVIRGRNHPSIVIWSIGNEIDYPNDPYVHPLFAEMTGNNDANKPPAERVYNPQKPNMERLAVIARELVGIVKKHDTTRPVLTAAAFPELSSKLGFLDALDLAGYNYKEQFYAEDHKRFPGLPLLGSENGHHLAAWRVVRDNEYISGQFLWTGIDYLGEARGWPFRASGAGILDLAGNEKIGWFRRKSLWKDEPALYLAVRPAGDGAKEREIAPWELVRSWNFSKGRPVELICYTNLPGAELFLNGRSLGQKKREDDREYLSWTTPFERGLLEAKDLDGKTVDRLESTLPGVELRARLWQPQAPDGTGSGGAYRLSQIEVEILDEEGRLCTAESPLVEAVLSGPGILAGMENGDIADCSEYAAPRRRLYRGRLVVYVLCPRGGEKTTVSLSAGGLAGAAVQV